MSEAALQERVERLEKQVSDLSLALAGLVIGTDSGYLDGDSYPEKIQHMAAMKSHVSRGGFVGLEVTQTFPDRACLSVIFKIVPIGELRGVSTAWERISG